MHNPSFATFARLCGGHDAKVTDASELDPAIKEALNFKGPAVVEIMSDMELIQRPVRGPLELSELPGSTEAG